MKHGLILLLLTGVLTYTGCKEKTCIQIPDGAFPVAYNGHLYVDGEADSIKGRFVFDTGASNLYFDSTYYADKNFCYEHTLTAKIPGAGTSLQTVIVVDDTVDFRFGEYQYRTTRVPVLQLKPILGDIADGILGMEYFYNSVLEINYEKEYMKVYPDIDSTDTEGWTRIGLTRKKSRLLIPLQVIINDTVIISGEFLLDFGSGTSVNLTSKVSEQYDLKNAVDYKVPFFTKYGGVGGESSRCDFTAQQVKIGDFAFDNVIMNYSEDKTGALASENYLGLLGNKIYERFDIYIDFINNDLYLRPNNSYNDLFKPSRSGFSYVDRGVTLNAWIVTGLYSESNAEKGGLKIDDRILSVNGTKVVEISFEQQDSFFEDADTVSLEVERNGEVLEISFNLKPVITLSGQAGE